jgi:hypothetical protein
MENITGSLWLFEEFGSSRMLAQMAASGNAVGAGQCRVCRLIARIAATFHFQRTPFKAQFKAQFKVQPHPRTAAVWPYRGRQAVVREPRHAIVRYIAS